MKLVYNFPKVTKLDNIENEVTSRAPIDHYYYNESMYLQLNDTESC